MGLDMMLVHDGNDIGYWRKANAIHKWFVDNVQGGVDDCGDYKVTKEQLIQLHNTCNDILNDPNLAEQLLPTQSGFFFGNAEYDENYMLGIEHTIEIVKEAIEDEYETYYESSW
jgi:phage pi2 protein 07